MLRNYRSLCGNKFLSFVLWIIYFREIGKFWDEFGGYEISFIEY